MLKEHISLGLNQTLRIKDTSVLNNIIPNDPNKPYHILTVIEAVSDRNKFYQIMPAFTKNIITGFAEVEGRSVGIVAN